MESFWLLETGDEYLHAIEAEPGLEVFESRSLTRLPLSNAKLAGLALVEGKSLIVADIGNLLGLSSEPSAGSLLFRLTGAEIAFLAPTSVRSVELPNPAILPLPELFADDCLRGCIVIAGRPIPLIDLARLQEKFAKHSRRPGQALRKLFPTLKSQLSDSWRILLAGGGKPFALPETIFPSPLRPKPQIAALGGMPPGIIGVCADKDKMLPVLSLGRLLSGSSSSDENYLLAGGTGSVDLAIATEGERPAISGCQPLLLPPWGRRSGIEKAIMTEGELIPVLEVERLIQGDPIMEPSPPSPILPSGSWEVNEFMISGFRHAVLKEEVAEVLPPLSWYRVPGLLPIIEGIAYWRDEVWPVVNLSCYFGRLDFTENSCMIALQRGSCRLLLLAEGLVGVKLVKSEQQRPLPLKVPHSLVSGCYLEGDAVILLLDVPALVKHFDPALVKDFCSVLQVRTGGKREEAAPKTAVLSGASMVGALTGLTDAAASHQPDQETPVQASEPSGCAAPEYGESTASLDPQAPVAAQAESLVLPAVGEDAALPEDQPDAPAEEQFEWTDSPDPALITAAVAPEDQPSAVDQEEMDSPAPLLHGEPVADGIPGEPFASAEERIEPPAPFHDEETAEGSDDRPAANGSQYIESPASGQEISIAALVAEDQPLAADPDQAEAPAPPAAEETVAAATPEHQPADPVSPEEEFVIASPDQQADEPGESTDSPDPALITAAIAPEDQPSAVDQEKMDSPAPLLHGEPVADGIPGEPSASAGERIEPPVPFHGEETTEVPDDRPAATGSQYIESPASGQEISIAALVAEDQPLAADPDQAETPAPPAAEETVAAATSEHQPADPVSPEEESAIASPDQQADDSGKSSGNQDWSSSSPEEFQESVSEPPPYFFENDQKKKLNKPAMAFGLKSSTSGDAQSDPFNRAIKERRATGRLLIAGTLLGAGLLIGWSLLRSPADPSQQEIAPPGDKIERQIIPSGDEKPLKTAATAASPPLAEVSEARVPPPVQSAEFEKTAESRSTTPPAQRVENPPPAKVDAEPPKVSAAAAPPSDPAIPSKSEPAVKTEQQQFSPPPLPIAEKKEPAPVPVAPQDPSNRKETTRQDTPLSRTGNEPYLVKKGDTLWHISERLLGNPMYYTELALENRISNPDLIYPGQVLVFNRVIEE